MKLKQLFKDIPVEQIKGSKEVEIKGICSHSQSVAPGDLFIAKSAGPEGRYIQEAVAAGAAVILTDMCNPFLNQVVQVVHKNIASIEDVVAARYYKQSHIRLYSIAYTGTNGKTTGTFLIKHLFDGLGLLCGVIGTVEWLVGKYSMPSRHTTPDIVTNHKLFAEMVHNGCRAVAMEVSSHALVQERVRGLQFDVAVFTNLTQDHLDYHHTMEAYADAKAKLFTSHAKAAVVNVDNSWHGHLVAKCKTPLLTYGIEQSADLMAHDIVLGAQGTSFDVSYQGQRFPFTTDLIGRFNVYNCLAAIGVGLTKGIGLETILSILKTFKGVPGRLEKVTLPKEYTKEVHLFVDYAHTPDALENVLSTLSEIKKGRLITLFGCGGDRDRTKRPQMAAAAEKWSDVIVVTSDNPRSENPETIVADILRGFQNTKNVKVEIDRYRGIESAIKMAAPGDVVLIAGKGHETTQIFAHHILEFDDRKVTRSILHELDTNQSRN